MDVLRLVLRTVARPSTRRTFSQQAAARNVPISSNRISGTPIRQQALSAIQSVEQKSGSVSPFLIDSFGREHDYLRISLTEKCNLRCTYCMPEQGVPLLPQGDTLTTDEIERVARMFVRQGVRKIRLTGGEPTVRRDLVDVVERLGRLGLDSLGMTSNGIALKRKLPALVAAGLTHLNLSLDTLDTFKYELITRRRGFERVMEALEAAEEFPELVVKLNVVVVKGLNDEEIPAFVELTRNRKIVVRFIEYMPFEDNNWSTTKLIPSSALVSKITSLHPTLRKSIDPKSDTTRSWSIPGWKGAIGFISSMSDHFCGGCSRLRIGADGGVKVCLFGPPVLNLRPLLRATTDDLEILPKIGAVVKGKKFAHDGLGGPRRRPTSGLFPFALLPQSPPFYSSIRYSSSASAHRPAPQLTHIDPKTGLPSMVSVSSKEPTLRTATAIGNVYINQVAWDLIVPSSAIVGAEAGGVGGESSTMQTKKGDVLLIAQLAGLMGAKLTSSLIPLCHPLPLTHLAITLTPHVATRSIEIRATAECEGKTGVEMEALTGVSVAALTVWDMLKSVAGREMRIAGIMVVRKSGGKSGDWSREE